MGCAGMERIKIEDDKGTVALSDEAKKDWERAFAFCFIRCFGREIRPGDCVGFNIHPATILSTGRYLSRFLSIFHKVFPGFTTKAEPSKAYAVATSPSATPDPAKTRAEYALLQTECKAKQSALATEKQRIEYEIKNSTGATRKQWEYKLALWRREEAQTESIAGALWRKWVRHPWRSSFC
jgi:hypothetical protein